jgi:hypothetical protein
MFSLFNFPAPPNGSLGAIISPNLPTFGNDCSRIQKDCIPVSLLHYFTQGPVPVLPFPSISTIFSPLNLLFNPEDTGRRSPQNVGKYKYTRTIQRHTFKVVISISFFIFYNEISNFSSINIRVTVQGIANKKFWEELIAYFPSIKHGPHRKRLPPTILRCHGNVLIEVLPSNDREVHRHTSPITFVLSRVFVAAWMCLPSRCLAIKWGIHFA